MDLDAFPTLTDAQRVQARRNAERSLIAKYARQPHRTDFDDYTVSEYPRWFTVTVAVGLVFIALAAGVISAFRLYHAGYSQFYQDIPNEAQARVVGILTPLAAEVLVIVAAIFMQMYAHRHGAARWIAAVPVITGTVVAFVGNWQITQPGTTWSWVETIFPPVAVLSVAFLFELTMVPEITRRQDNEKAYRAARDDYDRIQRAPETHPQWRDTYGWALWEMWSKVYGNAVQLQEIDREARQDLARREMDADAFFTGDVTEITGNSSISAASVSKREVLDWLRARPDVATLSGKEIAAMTGASEATVSRARAAFSSNGYSHADKDED